jgi:uncharacterized OB-fold protein
MFPVLPLSPCGHDDPLVLGPLDTPGTVHSWTRVAEGGGREKLLAMVDFLDGELRVIAPVVGVGDLQIGDQLTLVTGGDNPYELRPLPAHAGSGVA